MKIDKKIVKNCQRCRKFLPKYHIHHKYCKKCWEEIQMERGNFSLIGGLK